VHNRWLSLEDVLRSAEVVLEVTPREPPYTTIEEAIDTPTWNGEPCPPFSTPVWHFEVRDVLSRQPVSWAKRGEDIDVRAAEEQRDRKLHREYYVVGKSRSYAREAYQSPQLAEGEARLIFVRQDGDGTIRFAVPGAVESMERLGDVAKLL
jgi:hypothetical protein